MFLMTRQVLGLRTVLDLFSLRISAVTPSLEVPLPLARGEGGGEGGGEPGRRRAVSGSDCEFSDCDT